MGRAQAATATEAGATAGSLAALRAVVEGWGLAVDGDELAQALGLLDRLHAKLHRAVAELDAASLWEHDGATSMTAWLRDRGGMTRAEASTTVGMARRLRRWTGTAAAWEAGELTGGQVRAISANVGRAHVERYASQEDALIPVLAPLSVVDTARVMGTWRARAEAADEAGAGADGPPEPRRHLHLSPMLDGRHRLDGELDAEGAAIVAQALAGASTPGAPGDPRRSPAERRADSLVDVCRRSLVDRSPVPGRRQRPHISVAVDLLDLGVVESDDLGRDAATRPEPPPPGGATSRSRGGARVGSARLEDGSTLDQATTQRLLCDAGVHRFVTAGRSVILDYGTATRTISPGLFQALARRDGGCRWPGCDRGTSWCEAHHVVHWLAGGSTGPDNLVLLCSRHHHLAHGQHGHRPGWSVALAGDGTFTVTSPEGRATRSRPPP